MTSPITGSCSMLMGQPLWLNLTRTWILFQVREIVVQTQPHSSSGRVSTLLKVPHTLQHNNITLIVHNQCVVEWAELSKKKSLTVNYSIWLIEQVEGGGGLTLALPNDWTKVISHRPEEQTHMHKVKEQFHYTAQPGYTHPRVQPHNHTHTHKHTHVASYALVYGRL